MMDSDLEIYTSPPKRKKTIERPESEFIGEISQSDVESLSEQISKDDRSYLNSVSGVYFNNAILTSNLTEVAEECKKSNRVAILGPKGCGKTYTLVVLFALCLLKCKNCVFLSSKSFRLNNMDYFQRLSKKHFENTDGFTMDNLLHDKDAKMVAVVTVLKKLCEKYEDFMIFADFSKFETEISGAYKDFKNSSDLLETLISVDPFSSKVIVSVSSGVKLGSNDEYDKYLQHFNMVKLSIGFTTMEATKYLEKIKPSWSLDQIRQISGSNPYLLSLISSEKYLTISEYQGRVEKKVKDALQQHVSGLVKTVQSIEEYFKQEQMLECTDLVYLANREDNLFPEQKKKYERSCLHLHMLTVLDHTPTVEVLEDQDVTDRNKADICTSKQECNYSVLRWNFPILGRIFLDVLRNFIKEHTKNDLIGYCNKVSTFAGCWYECMFFSVLKDCPYIEVLCTIRAASKPMELKLTFDDVCEIEIDKTMKKGIIYEMRAYYPVVDAVGCLLDDTGKEWLVFIQISLSKYKDHRSLCDLFHKSNLQSNVSIYTYYRRLYNIERFYKNVLLLYFSPQEKPSSSFILPELKTEILRLKDLHLKNYLNFGILSAKSRFHGNPDFQMYFKEYL